jgi:hypothetical protein
MSKWSTHVKRSILTPPMEKWAYRVLKAYKKARSTGLMEKPLLAVQITAPA